MEKFGILICGGPFRKDDFTPFSFNGKRVDFYSLSSDYNPSEIKVIVGYKLTRELLWSLPNLALIHIPFAGVDIVDLSIVKERGIPLSNSHTNAKAVAEFTITLLFSLIKKIPFLDKYMRKGEWKGRWEKDILNDFWGMSVTILGFGAIGREIACMLKPFGMKIFAVKRKLGEEVEGYKHIVDKFGTKKDLITFLNESNALVVSIPLTSHTENLISEEILEALGYGYLVNISRGKIIQEEVLYRYLKEGKLKGAALDVWWNYPKKGDAFAYPSQFPFWELDNVILTPHTAGVTYSFLQSAKEEIINIIKDLIVGKLPKNLVDLSQGY